MTDTASRFGQPRAPARWGKAGVRLNPDEAEKADRRHRTEANKTRIADEAAHRKAHQDWKAGHVVPWRITTALDRYALYGPEVDAACGVQEPTVDNWEAGIVYPTWEQLLALAELAKVTPGVFMWRDWTPLRAQDTSLRFHMPVDDEEPPVMAFTPEAIAAAVAGEGACPTCRRPR